MFWQFLLFVIGPKLSVRMGRNVAQQLGGAQA